MSKKGRKTIHQHMRSLHRDIGFFIVGITIIYCLSGIVLIYRNTNFLKQENWKEQNLAPNMSPSELGKNLCIRNFKIEKTEGAIIYFKNGTYNKETGYARYSEMKLPVFVQKFNKLHKASSKKLTHWFSAVFGVLLLFMAISSFWMYKSKTKLFHRGIYIAAAGVVAAVLLVVFAS